MARTPGPPGTAKVVCAFAAGRSPIAGRTAALAPRRCGPPGMSTACPAIVTMDLAGAPADPAATPAPATTSEAVAQPAIASAAIAWIPGRLPGSHRDRFICSPSEVPPWAGRAGRPVLISTDRRPAALQLANSRACQGRCGRARPGARIARTCFDVSGTLVGEMLGYRILGPLEVSADGRVIEIRGPKQRALLAILLLRANEPVPRDVLVHELWGERPPAGAQGSLDVYVSRLRKVLTAAAGEPVLVTRPGAYLL